MGDIVTTRLMHVNNRSGISPFSPFAHNNHMDIFATRKANLRLIKQQQFAGNEATMASALGIKASQLNRWLSLTTNDPRNVREDSARNMEEKLGLPRGALDKPNLGADYPVSESKSVRAEMPHAPGEAELLKCFNAMDPKDRVLLLGLARRLGRH